ncbi:MAG: hypothetical protein H7343_23565 [Undibacterium sp.]|nr:hypothetical protein [Opitutaceae bacterium]
MKSPRFAVVWLSIFWLGSAFGLEADPQPVETATRTEISPEIAAAKSELEAMFITDQAQRRQMSEVEKTHGANSAEMRALWSKQNESDAHNIVRLEEIIAKHGWPKRSVFGDKAAAAAFFILQHSGPSYQKKYLPPARAAALAQEMNGSHLALLEDRILVRENKNQIYGSQVHRNEAGDFEAHPIEDAAHVDQRRAALGMSPLAQYLQGFADRSGGKVANAKDELPPTEAPPLTQHLFTETDGAKTAYDKLRLYPPQRGDAALQFQLACRDFCLRFLTSSLYGAVRVLAATFSGWLTAENLTQLRSWNPAEGESDPRLNVEQRARIAVLNVTNKPPRAGPGISEADARLDLLANALRPHLRTDAARDGLAAAAVDASPAKAIALLREIYPGDIAVMPTIAALELMGRLCNLKFMAVDGRAFDLQELRGKAVIVLFSSVGDQSWAKKYPQI